MRISGAMPVARIVGYQSREPEQTALRSVSCPNRWKFPADHSRSQVDAGEEISDEFEVAGGDGAKLLEFVEEALDWFSSQ